jgi:hypothetical protein
MKIIDYKPKKRKRSSPPTPPSALRKRRSASLTKEKLPNPVEDVASG